MKKTIISLAILAMAVNSSATTSGYNHQNEVRFQKVMDSAQAMQAQESQPTGFQPFSPPSATVSTSTQKTTLTDAEIKDKLRLDLQKSGKQAKLVISKEEFRKKINETGSILMDFSENPKNTLYIFTDPGCPKSAIAYQQIIEQQMLMQSNGINVKWIPIVQNGDSELHKRAVNLFVESIEHQDTTPRQMREYIKDNTMMYATAFDKIATPLVVWDAGDGVEIMLGYPKPQNARAFLSTVSDKEGLVSWLFTLAKK